MSTTQRILEALPPPGDPVAVATVAKILPDIERKQIVKSLEVLRRRKLIDKPATNRFILNKAGERFRADGRKITSGANGPHTGRRKGNPNSYRQKLWSAIRRERKSTIPELIALIDDPSHRGAESNAHRYFKVLVEAGYLSKLARKAEGVAPASSGFNIYLLIQDTGSEAPRWNMQKGELYDPNKRQVVWRRGGDDAVTG